MELDIDVYFWLVDRGCYDDDQRNKVDMERNKVKMHREHSQRLENGYYIAKLMNILKKSVVSQPRNKFYSLTYCIYVAIYIESSLF
jgi:hypothetical protein